MTRVRCPAGHVVEADLESPRVIRCGCGLSFDPSPKDFVDTPTTVPSPNRRGRESAMQPDLDYQAQRQREMEDPEWQARFMPGFDVRNPPTRTGICDPCGGSGRDPARHDPGYVPTPGLPEGWCAPCRGGGRVVIEP